MKAVIFICAQVTGENVRNPLPSQEYTPTKYIIRLMIINFGMGDYLRQK